MNILFLSRWCPYPVDNGSKVRVFNMLRCLCSRHRVTLVSFFEPHEKVAAEDLQPLGVRNVRLIPYRPFDPFRARALVGFLNLTPRSIVDTRSPDLERTLRDAVDLARYDVVIASQVWMASYWHCFRGIPAIFEEAELGLFRRDYAGEPSLVNQFRGRLTWAKHRRFMDRLVRKFALCTVVSEQEKRLLSEAAPGYGSVHVIPNAIDLESCELIQAPREDNSLVFAGSFNYLPNYDAMNWFLTEIYPVIKSRAVDARLTITGHGANRPLPPAEDVTRTGSVTDARPFVAASAVSIAPIRVGAGTRLKVLEAMALRTPIVATSKAVEGLDVETETHFLQANDANEFAEAVVRLLEEPWTARRLAENAYRLVKKEYDWAVIAPRWSRLVEHAAYA